MMELVTALGQNAQAILLVLSIIYAILWAETVYDLAGRDNRIAFYLALFIHPVWVLIALINLGRK